MRCCRAYGGPWVMDALGMLVYSDVEPRSIGDGESTRKAGLPGGHERVLVCALGWRAAGHQIKPDTNLQRCARISADEYNVLDHLRERFAGACPV